MLLDSLDLLGLASSSLSVVDLERFETRRLFFLVHLSALLEVSRAEQLRLFVVRADHLEALAVRLGEATLKQLWVGALGSHRLVSIAVRLDLRSQICRTPLFLAGARDHLRRLHAWRLIFHALFLAH